MIVVHHLEHSRSQRILWLLEELGAPYEVKRYARDPVTNLAPPVLKSAHPAGKSPVIEDDGRIVAETGAIVEYLLDRHGDGALRPARDTDDYVDYLYWSHAAEGSFMPPLVMELLLARMESAKMPFFARPVARRLARGVRAGYLDHTIAALFGEADARLRESDWFVGDRFTAADIMMGFPMEAARTRVAPARRSEAIAAFVDRIHARDAYQRALARGGPYAYA